MLKHILSFQTKIISCLLGLLGVVACDNLVDMYGTPSATYKIKGTVVNEKDQPIKNIRAVISDVPVESGWRTTKDTVYTNNSGEFNFSKDGLPFNEMKMAIELTDIDGVENGEYQSKADTIIFKRGDLSGGDGNWNEGTATRDLGKIKLERKR